MNIILKMMDFVLKMLNFEERGNGDRRVGAAYC